MLSSASTIGEFLFLGLTVPIQIMKTIEETRRSKLQVLVDRHGGMANLCEALGYARNETATLTRILHANVRHERGGTKTYNMGSPMAREIETKLGLDIGWLDTPIGYSDLQPDQRIIHVMKIMESMPDWQRDQAMRIIDTFAEPASTARNGTDG